MSLVDLVQTSRPELNGHHITTEKAAEILGITQQVVRNYIRGELLREVDQPKRVIKIHAEEVELLRRVQEAYTSLKKDIREIYLLHREGASLDYLAEEFDAKETEVDYAIALYKYIRRLQLKKYKLPEKTNADALFQKEILARLRSSRNGHIPDLIVDGLFNGISTEYADRNMLVSYESFEMYLAKINAPKGKRLYKSRDAKRIIYEQYGTVVSIEKIDIVARENEIGIKENSNDKLSRYLFTREEISRIYNSI